MKRNYGIILLVFSLIALALGNAGVSFAIDPPHLPEFGVTCASCHSSARLSQPSSSIDNTPWNMVCTDCHKTGGVATAKKTHSANTTGSTYWSGAWTTECKQCHDPHAQKQIRAFYKDDAYPKGPYLVKGGVLNITNGTGGIKNVLTVQGNPGWATEQWKGYVLIPTTGQPGIMYRIINSTSNTIITLRPLPLSITNGNTYAIGYGKLVKEYINSGRIIQNDAGAQYAYPPGAYMMDPDYGLVPITSPTRYVKVFNNVGPNSPSPTGEGTNVGTKAVCIVCHTRTSVNNIAYAIYNQTFDPAVVNTTSVGSHSSTSDTSTCWRTDGTCHVPLDQGGGVAGAKCGDCHGGVLVNTSHLVKKIKFNNSWSNTGTGVTTVGAHSAHNYRYTNECQACHYGGMLVINDNDLTIGDYKLTVAMYLNASGNVYNTGVYNGATLLNSFVYNGYSMIGNVAGGLRTTCSNTYCHGATLTKGTKLVPRWTDSGMFNFSSKTCSAEWCHGASAANPLTLGSHAKHTGTANVTMMVTLACTDCHTHNDSLIDSSHVDGKAQWRIKTSDGRIGASALYCGVVEGFQTVKVPTPNASYGNCASLYCHSNANSSNLIYKSVKWGSAAMNCSSCHDAPGGADTWSAPHGKHVNNSASSYAFTCNACHSSVAANNNTLSDKTLHVNAQKEVVFNATYGGSYPGTCQGVKCHSTGIRLDTGTEAPVSGIWWTGTLNCGDCHKSKGTEAQMTSTANGVGVMSSAHPPHAATDKAGYGCEKCHNTTTTTGTTITNKVVHSNLLKEVKFDSVGTWNGTNYRCSSTNCHGVVSDAWTENKSGINSCTICHGLETAGSDTNIVNAAPGANGSGTDTAGRTSPTIKNVGAHDAHVRAISSYTSPIGCTECHVVPTGVNDAGHIDNALPAELTWGALAKKDTLLSPNYANVRCTNTYCHGGKLPSASNNMMDNRPAWTNTAYLTGTPNMAGGDCDKCHGSPPLGYTDTDHASATTLSTCNGCHNHVNVDGTFNDASKHINKIVEATACGGCHGTPPINNATSLMDSLASGRKSQFQNAAGLHDYHYNAYGFSDCAYCHKGAEGIANHNEATKRIQIGFDYAGSYTYGYYQAPSFANANYGLLSSNANTQVQTTAGGRTCSNLYCHSDGGNYAGSITTRWANWDVGGMGVPTKACDICHGGSGKGAFTDRHPKHINGVSGDYSYNCIECHAGTVNGSNNIIGNHVDKIKNIDFAGSGSKTNGGSYSRPNCSSSYCHSPGNKNSAYDQARVIAKWDSNNMPSDCSGCHSSDADAAAKMSSVTHLTHIDNATAAGLKTKCSECHYSTVSVGNRTVSGVANHVDRLVNVKFDPNGMNKNTDGPMYNAASTTVAVGVTRTPGYVNGRNCSAVYCHSTGNLDGSFNMIGAYNTIAWDGAGIDCTGCHGNGTTKSHPVYVNGGAGTTTANSHVKHVESSRYGCDQCHVQTTLDFAQYTSLPTAVNGTSGLHLNRQENVNIKLVYGKTGTYNADKSCSNTYCHGTLGPRWGDITHCDSCHAANNGSQKLAARHDVHYNTTTAIPVDVNAVDAHTNAGYVYGCGKCHPDYAHATGPVIANKQDAQVNGTMIYISNYAAGATNAIDGNGYNYTLGGTCSTYCHTDGIGTYVPVVWNAVGVGAPANCDDCHGGASGSIITSNKHGVHISDTTYNYTCEECHAGTVTGDTTINLSTQRDNHTNQVKEVSWKTGGHNLGGSAYLSPNCSNIYCHSEGLKASAPFTSKQVAWSAGAQGCNACHGAGVDLSSPIATGSHASHVNNASVIGKNYRCQDCHDATAIGNGTINPAGGVANHVDKMIAVKFAGGANTSGTYSGSTLSKRAPESAAANCSNLYCHSTGKNGVVALANLPAAYGTPKSHFSNVLWGSADIGCNGCHGKSNARGWPDYTNNVLLNGTDQSNSHSTNTHANSACNYCHVTVSASNDNQIAAGSSLHTDGARQVVLNATAGGVWNGTAKSCSAMTCHGGSQVVWGAAGGCASCHGNPPVSTATMIGDSSRKTEPWVANASGLHNYHYTTKGLNDCYYCHTGGGSQESGHPSGLQNKVHMGFSYLGKVTGVYNGDKYDTKYVLVNGNAGTTVYNSGSYQKRSCSAVYCHSDGYAYGGGLSSYRTVAWDNTPTGSCNNCHGDTSNVVVSAKHPKHVSTYKYICYECHSSTVDISNAVTGNHVNTAREVAWGNIASGSSAYSTGTPNCSNNYCHSEGLSTSAPFTTKTVDWTGTLDCGGCHSKASDATRTWSAKHNTHTVQYGLNPNYNCGACHAGTALNNTTISVIGNHVNKQKEVVFNSFSYSGATYGGGSCTNTYCHSSGASAASPTHAGLSWTAGAQGCNACHGASDELSTPIATGSHMAHVNNASVLGRNYRCQDCHNVNVIGNSVINGLGGLANHVDKTVAVQYIGANGTGTYNGTTMSKRASGIGAAYCSTLYCHSTGKAAYVAVANLPAAYGTPKSHFSNVLWGSAGIGCNGCHGKSNSKGWPDYTNNVLLNGTDQSNSHSGTTHANSECNACHNNTVAQGSDTQIKAGSTNHIDGLRQIALNATVGGVWNGTAKSCSNMSCHSGSQVVWGAAGGCASCHGYPPVSTATMIGDSSRKTEPWVVNASGLHNYHYTTKGLNDCYYCHTGGGSQEAGHPSGLQNKVHMGFSYLGKVTGVYNGDKYDTKYVLVNGNAGTTVYNTNSYQKRSCSAVYCHSDGYAYGGGLTAYRTVAWDNTPTGSCNNCHGDTSNVVTTAIHPKHVSTYKYVCNECHAQTVNLANALVGNHVNVAREVAWGNIASGSSAYSTGTPNCSNNYCHSEGLSASAPFSSKTADWTGTLGCNGCHGGTAGAGSIATGSHKPHIDNAGTLGANYKCQDCHNLTSTGNTVGNYVEHVNKMVAVQFFGGSNATGTHNGATASVRGIAGSAAYCSNLYCHSTGKNGVVVLANLPAAYGGSHFANVLWGSTGIGCNGCHGKTNAKGWPDYTTGAKGTTQANSHSKHASNLCLDCHYSTTRNDTAIYDLGGYTAHMNGASETVFNATGLNSSGAYNGNKSCSTTYCHGTLSPQWGDAGSTNCKSCHLSMGATSDIANYTGVHAKHVNSTAGNYKYACEQCHQMDYGSVKVNHGGGPTAVANQTAEVKWAETSGLINYPSGGGPTQFVYNTLTTNPYNTTGISPIYSNGVFAGNDPKNAQVQWSNGTCSTVWCHSNALPLGGTNSYKAPQWSGTLGCGGCHSQASEASPTWSERHNVHTKTYGMNANYTCYACHAGVALNNTTILAGGLLNHVDGKKQVQFGALWNSAATYTNSNNACTNTYCHSAGTSITGTSHAPLSWNAGAQDCASCHGNPPAYADGTPKDNSHAKHSASCSECHYSVTMTNTGITNAAAHVNRLYNIKNSTSVAFNVAVTGTPTVPTVCSNISCHGGSGTGATWGGTVACEGCHNVSAGDNDNFTWSNMSGQAGTVAVLNNAEWTSTGHGRTSGNYGSGNSFANLACLDCHASGVNHNQPSPPNYFRLREGETGIGNSGTTWGKNWICAVCHDPSGPGLYGGTKDSIAFVNSRHLGAEHTANVGGQFCWDCHDPHGDANRYMVHLKPTMNSSSATMLPVSLAANNVSFTANATGTDYVKAGPSFNGVCQVCHTKSAIDHYRVATSDGHNAGIRCTTCHKHKEAESQNTAFGSSGKCNSCHGYPPKPPYIGGGDGFVYKATQGKGVHNSHTTHMQDLTGYTLNPDTDQWADATVTAVCFVCHKGATHEMGGGPRTIAMDSAEYTLSIGAPVYLGEVGTAGATKPKTCSNVSCHYISTPEWESY